MAKRLDSRYLPGKRTRDWLKIKTHYEQEFVVAGYTKGTGRRASSFGSLVLGYYVGNELVYAGNVGTGFNSKEIEKLLDKLRPLRRAAPPFREAPKMPKVRKGDVIWGSELVGEVEFASGRTTAPSCSSYKACARQFRGGCGARSRSRLVRRARERSSRISTGVFRPSRHKRGSARVIPACRARVVRPQGPPVHNGTLARTGQGKSSSRRPRPRTCQSGFRRSARRSRLEDRRGRGSG